MPHSSAMPRGGARTERSFQNIYEQHKRNFAWALIVVIAIAVGGWFFARSRAIQQQRSEAAYFSALRSVAAGNVPLAQSDLRKLITRYPKTTAGVEGAMALAKLYYTEGKFQQGVDVLTRLPDGGGSRVLQAGVRNLTAVGYAGLNRPAQAAKEYLSAAERARFDADADRARANAARALTAAGDTAGAVRIWTRLAGEEKSLEAAEARIRLGELTVKQVKS